MDAGVTSLGKAGKDGKKASKTAGGKKRGGSAAAPTAMDVTT